MTEYTDYRLRARSLDDIRAALAALRTAGLVGDAEGPENMLGDPQTDAEGRLAFRASRGRAALTVQDEDGQTLTIPARGDPDFWYVAVRALRRPEELPVDPTAYGLEWCDPAESAAVLGVWA